MLANSSGRADAPHGDVQPRTARSAASSVRPPGLARSFWCSRNRSVMMRPGRTRLTVMPSLAEIDRQRLEEARDAGPDAVGEDEAVHRLLHRAGLDGQDAAPLLGLFMSGRTSRMSRTVERWTCSKACVHCSSVIFSKGPGGGPPTLATRTSTPPQASLALRHRPRRVLGAAERRRAPPAPRRRSARFTSAAASFSAASPRAHIRTRAPSAREPQRARLAHALARRRHEGHLALEPRSMGTPLSDCADQDVCL